MNFKENNQGRIKGYLLIAFLVVILSSPVQAGEWEASYLDIWWANDGGGITMDAYKENLYFYLSSHSGEADVFDRKFFVKKDSVKEVEIEGYWEIGLSFREQTGNIGVKGNLHIMNDSVYFLTLNRSSPFVQEHIVSFDKGKNWVIFRQHGNFRDVHFFEDSIYAYDARDYYQNNIVNITISRLFDRYDKRLGAPDTLYSTLINLSQIHDNFNSSNRAVSSFSSWDFYDDLQGFLFDYPNYSKDTLFLMHIDLREGEVLNTRQYPVSDFVNEDMERELYSSLQVLSESELFLPIQNNIFYSSDGGASWEQKELPTNVILNDIQFYNERDGIAVGEEGTVIFTRDSGRTWHISETDVSNDLENVRFTEDEKVYISGQPNLILEKDSFPGSTEVGLKESQPSVSSTFDFTPQPNPFSNQLSISFKGIVPGKKVDLRIVDLSGRAVWEDSFLTE